MGTSGVLLGALPGQNVHGAPKKDSSRSNNELNHPFPASTPALCFYRGDFPYGNAAYTPLKRTIRVFDAAAGVESDRSRQYVPLRGGIVPSTDPYTPLPSLFGLEPAGVFRTQLRYRRPCMWLPGQHQVVPHHWGKRVGDVEPREGLKAHFA